MIFRKPKGECPTCGRLIAYTNWGRFIAFYNHKNRKGKWCKSGPFVAVYKGRGDSSVVKSGT